jgi:hypothetical protein
MPAYKPVVRCLAVLILWGASTWLAADEGGHVRVYDKNPRYWQYKGQPVLLLGGSKTDHIFLAEGLREHLDEMVVVGANYVRNTMSQREDVDLKPHQRLPGGKFDLDQWNDEYWQRFADCLRWCHEREIIIQIEVWDRFDFSREHWQISPWRPRNNLNYGGRETGLSAAYPAAQSHQDLLRRPVEFWYGHTGRRCRAVLAEPDRRFGISPLSSAPCGHRIERHGEGLHPRGPQSRVTHPAVGRKYGDGPAEQPRDGRGVSS